MSETDTTSPTLPPYEPPYRFEIGAFVKWTSDYHHNIKTHGIVCARRVTRWGDIEYQCAPRFNLENLTWLPDEWLKPDE